MGVDHLTLEGRNRRDQMRILRGSQHCSRKTRKLRSVLEVLQVGISGCVKCHCKVSKVKAETGQWILQQKGKWAVQGASPI